MHSRYNFRLLQNVDTVEARLGAVMREKSAERRPVSWDLASEDA